MECFCEGRRERAAGGSSAMALKIDYYTTLSRAVAGLDRDSYAARGAVYDREHKALMRRLFSADPPLADGDVQREQRAFRDAIRRVEFGEDEIEIPLVPQRDPPEYGSPAAAGARRAQSNLSRARTLPSPQKSSGEVWPLRRPVQGPPVAQGIASVDPALELMPDPAAPVPPTTAAQVEGTAAAAALLKRKPIGGRVFGRALIGIALLGLSAVAYDLLTGEIGLPLLQKLAGTR